MVHILIALLIAHGQHRGWQQPANPHCAIISRPNIDPPPVLIGWVPPPVWPR